MAMFEKLVEVEKRFIDIEGELCDPNIISSVEKYTALMKETKLLTPVVIKFRELRSAKEAFDEAKELLCGETDMELKELAELQMEESREIMESSAEELKVLLIPRDPNDNRNVIVEIRGGAGGEESALFASSLFRMYSMYSEKKGFKVEVINTNETELGGFKEISFSVSGDGAYSRFKFESGVHRVQRVPETESGGRVHTSTSTVAVLPEVDDVEIEINVSDLQIDTYRASGAGGQHVNTTDSAIRITHLPTGLVVECQDERSQHKNRDKAMKVLRARLYEQQQSEQDSQIAANRKSQVGTGDRSERIRTYNFPQGRVSDHRISLTLHKLDAIMDGDIDELVDALITADQAEKMQASGNEG